MIRSMFDAGVTAGMDTTLRMAQERGQLSTWSVGVGTLAPTSSGGTAWNRGFAWGVSLACGMIRRRHAETLALRDEAQAVQA